MPSTSKRSQNAYASPIRKLAPFALAAEAKGRKVYYLNIGQPDILTPKSALRAIQNLTEKVVKYAPAEGLLSYRQKLTGYYAEHGIAVGAEDIMITTGASEAIFFAMMACLDEGDEVIVPEPFYAIYNGFAEMAKVKIRPITSSISDGFQLPDTEAFESVINEKTKAILICNPNNPTGCVYAGQALAELGALVRKHDLFLIADEVYREFCYDGQVFHSVLNLPGLSEHAVVIDSISKRFSSCGARVGALVTRNKDIHERAVKYARFRLSPPVLGQILGEGTLDETPEYMTSVKAAYAERRELLYKRLSGIEGVTCYLPGGAFYCFVKLPIADAEHFCQWILEEFEYEGQTVMLAPGAGFYATEGLGKDEIRIAYVLNVEDLNRAMDCLEAALSFYRTKVRPASAVFPA